MDVDGITIVRFLDRKIIDRTNIQETNQEFGHLVEEEHKYKFILNFDTVEFLSSKMLDVLVRLQKKIEGAKGKLIFCKMKPQIYEVFVITRLNGWFDIVRDEQDALRKMGTLQKVPQ